MRNRRLGLPGLLILAGAGLSPLLVVPRAASAPKAPACPAAYPPRAHITEVKARVAALHRIEREAADRSVGLDTRPYAWLLEQARAAATAISVPALVAAEDKLLERCLVPALRRDCASGAAALVRVIEDLQAGRDTNEARMALALTMRHCESIVGLASPMTSLRSYQWPPQDADGKRRDGSPAR